MRSHEALSAALGMLSYPHLVRQARRSALPPGVTFLLEVAVGETRAVREAEALTGCSEMVLRKAAGFFIEQILLNRDGDNYRTLGASRETSNGEIRRHMALIMRWLHPDLFPNSDGFDRSLYVGRVTGAWETIKTVERRAAYDTSLAGGRSQSSNVPRLTHGPGAVVRNARRKQIIRPRRKDTHFWRIVFLLLGSRK
ncbi:heat shock protein DnaJ domain protein [Rhodomicrobium vannielii ATCC 17100]|uniref:Heat shock protein DnaJ domain protein n=1 Tax=Rhodomicrobium vannielii (strain ATCC 17100 / DSM 162 / LMG 4299 / NCIMB 10020 / ATH 3.1.1) TaxID=648757 RepID=E3I7Q8_RHOVT|nr:heat shock protein DnaJ domain protein [Rhodomicrobium vannielii ATCC 17100]